MSKLDAKKIFNGLSKTGYKLEFEVSEQLQRAEWTVINNKYYIDDVEESPREIDAVAYKVDDVDGVSVYTVLVISCKKSDENTWVLLSKDRSDKDPNTDWSPVTMWSNEEHIQFMLNHMEWRHGYVTNTDADVRKLFEPEKHIFAFQEINTKSGAPKNDKNIFRSIVSAMKSLNYEIESLGKRKKEKSVYNFNLITVLDAPLVRAMYKSDKTTVEEIKSDVYVGSYIVGKKETSSRVHIITAGEFGNMIGIYKKLHDHNMVNSSVLINAYFKDCVQDRKKVGLKIDAFRRKCNRPIFRILQNKWPDQDDIDQMSIDLIWNKKEKYLAIEIDTIHFDNDFDALNNDTEVRISVGRHLEELYQYKGKFKFEMAIPF